MNPARTVTDALTELIAVGAKQRRLARQRSDLMSEAVRLGATQDQIARRLGVSQATLSRQLSQAPEPDRAEAVIEAYEAGDLSVDGLIEQLLVSNQDPSAALDRALVRGSVSLGIVRRVEQALGSARSERERIEQMDPDLLADMLRATVQDALAYLRRTEDTSGQREDIARRARALRSTDPAARVDLILECRAILNTLDGQGDS